VVDRWSDYWYQHTRWFRNSLDAGRPDGRSNAPAGLARRIEIAASSAGYADRLALIAALALGGARRRSLWLASAYLLIRAFEVGVAVEKAGVDRRRRYLLATPVLFGLDALASFAGLTSHLLRLPRGWRRPSHRPGRDCVPCTPNR
jgi:hypothetical protein